MVAALTRYLGVSAFGVYTTAFVYVAFLAVLADFGFFWIMIREIAHLDVQKEYERVVNNVLTLRTFLGIGVLGVGSAIALLIPQYGHDVRVGIFLVAIASLASALNATLVGVFQNKLRMDKAVITDIIGRTVTLALTLWFIAQGAPITTIFASYIGGTWLNLVLSYFLAQQYVRVRPAFEFAVWHRIYSEAFPMGVAMILHIVYYRIDSILLSLMKGVADVGIYGVPYKILDVIMTLPVMFLGNVFPMLTRLLVEKSPAVPGVLQRSFDALLTIALPLTVGGILMAEPIIRLVGGEAFVHATTLAPFLGQPATAVLALQILLISAGISFVSNLFGYTLIALGLQRQLIRPYATFMVVNVLINLWLIPRFSYIGAAIGTTLTEIVVVVYFGYLACKATNVVPNLRLAGRIALATAVMGAFLTLVDLSLWWELTLAIAIYGAAAWGFGVVTPELLRELVRAKSQEARVKKGINE